MRQKIAIAAIAAALGASIPFYAQSPGPQPQAQAQQRPSGAAGMTDSKSIFCGTMHTGQLCSNGTSNVLKVSPEQKQAWLQAARKYNRAVETATQELFKDADATLTPEQAELLKAWFAVGLNPQINQLLYSKGLGAK